MIEKLLDYQSMASEDVEFLGFERVPLLILDRSRGKAREVENPAAWGVVPFTRMRTITVNYALDGHADLVVRRDQQKVVREGNDYLVTRLQRTTFHYVSPCEIEEMRQLFEAAIVWHHAAVVTTIERVPEVDVGMNGVLKYWAAR
jgi:hypothetical protein